MKSLRLSREAVLKFLGVEESTLSKEEDETVNSIEFISERSLWALLNASKNDRRISVKLKKFLDVAIYFVRVNGAHRTFVVHPVLGKRYNHDDEE